MIGPVRDDVPPTARGAARGVLQAVLSLALGPIPAAWRRRLDDRLGLDVDRFGALSGLVQLLAFFAVGMAGFFRWMEGVLGATPDAGGVAMLFLNPTLPLVYALTTPVGFLSAVFGLGGVVRMLQGAATGTNAPDPVFGALEALRSGGARRRAAARREAERGPPVPDRIEHAPAGTAADVRLTSWADLGWREGTGVLAWGASWRVLQAGETRVDGRLRFVYELGRLREAEVLHGVHRHAPAMPPIVIGEPKPADAPSPRSSDEAAPAPIPLSGDDG